MSSADSRAPIAWSYLVTAVLALVGLGDALYLTVQDFTGQSLRCTIISGCSEVLGSPYAHIGKIPLAVLGALAYFTLFCLAIFAGFGYQFSKPLFALLLAIMFLMTLLPLYLQAFFIFPSCPYFLPFAAPTTNFGI